MSRHIDESRPFALAREASAESTLRKPLLAVLLSVTFPLIVILSASFLAGCSDAEDRPATWSYVYTTVIQPNCTSSNCHTSPASTAGLRFETSESAYNYLTGKICETVGPPDESLDPDHNFVVPFQPDSSKLMYLLRGEEVRNMPPDVPLPDVEVELIEAWILEGAECD